jgi:CubicO group peptidase (beta-lactamase class C family)/penicillin V acylase-like amidase (Ntn superfamily)
MKRQVMLKGKEMENALLRALLFILLSTICLPFCAPAQPYRVPEQTDDGWRTASLDEVGIDEKKVREAINCIHDNTYENIHSILIVKDGKLVFEEYFSGYTWGYDDDQYQGELVDFGIDTTHNLASVTKSFTSALVGIAIDRGFIRRIDEKVFAFFPEYANLNDERKDKITLEHLLTMTSGLEWNEMELPYSNTNNDLVQLFIVPDPIEYILAKPVVSEPGTAWYYSGGNTNLLGEVIREATGLRMDDFAAEYLFTPLGIINYEWDHINPDMIHASGNLKLRPRDMAKFGYLFLNSGVWNDEQIVSQEWVETSTEERTSTPWGAGYGYQWWQRTYRYGSTSVDSFYAAGWGGQRIIVFPSLDMVLVFTGWNYVGEEPVDEIVTQYILPAVHPSSSPASASTDARFTIPVGSQACTSFCLDNNGYSVFGTNFDNRLYEGLLFVNKRNVSKQAWNPSTTGEYAQWTSKYGSVTFNLVGYQFAWAGMNEAGLMLSTMYLEETESPTLDEHPPLESPVWLQYQLDNYSTIKEVLASDALVRIANTQDHYLVCDRLRDCATVEFLDGEMVAHADQALPVAALTNSIYEESVQAWQENELSDNSLHRFGVAAERVMSFASKGEESAIDYAFDTLTQVGDSDWTQWSIVFDAENLRVYFRTRVNPEIRYLDLDKLDFTCGTSVEMLDVHENLAGDISSELGTYSHQVSFDHMTHFLQEWGLGAQSEWVETFLREAEDFPCTMDEAQVQQHDDAKGTTSSDDKDVENAGALRGWYWGYVVGIVVIMASGVYLLVAQKRSR